MDAEKIMSGLVRIGTVSAVDAGKGLARVLFLDTKHTSDWLRVVQHSGAAVRVTPDGAHTHAIADTYTGGGSAAQEPDHKHGDTSVTGWMPKVNTLVLVLYLPVFNADGFILGGI